MVEKTTEIKQCEMFLMKLNTLLINIYMIQVLLKFVFMCIITPISGIKHILVLLLSHIPHA